MERDAIRSILVASDLSEGSDGVVAAAAGLAERTGAALHVVHAVELLGHPVPEAALDLFRLRGVVQEARTRLHEQLARTLPPDLAPASVELDYRSAAPAILQRAKEVDAALVVVGPHRPRGPGSYVLGTTVQRVVEAAGVPCLVAGRPLRPILRRVLLPVGEADVRRGLLEAAGSWLAALRRQQEARSETRQPTELRVFHVVRALDRWRELSGDLARELRALYDRPEFGSLFRVHRAIAWSRHPAEEILRLEAELPLDLIAMGVRGHGPLLRALLGSVSSAVLRGSASPVLLFPARMFEGATSRPETPFPDPAPREEEPEPLVPAPTP